MRFMALAAATAGLLYADARCLPCHVRQVQSWQSTGMGRSIRPASATSVPRTAQEIRHKLSGTTFRVSTRSNQVVHEASRNGRNATYLPAWIIGSGNQGESYVHRVQDSLFQSPLSWYTERRAYGMSPGYEADPNPEFFRPVTPECLFCHSGAPRLRQGTQNRYLEPPFEPAAIGCERCHGDPAAHISKPERQTIVNPARLAPQLRDAICEQCHLSGEARIPNPGKHFADFRPGMRMEDVFSVYVAGNPADVTRLKVVSHSEQLRLSRCSVQSGGKLWCASCHDPHAEAADKVTWYGQKCTGCHSGPDTAAHERKTGRDCAGCHMPRLKAYDGGHTAYTDHWIRVRSRAPAAHGAEGLRAWREPAGSLRQRNLGLAYISAGLKSNDTTRMTTGLRLLSSAAGDSAVLTVRGMMLLRLNKSAEAVETLRRAVQEIPDDSTARFNLAVALFAAGERPAALRAVEETIALEPLLEDAYVLAAEIDPNRAADWKRRYLKLVPQRFVR